VKFKLTLFTLIAATLLPGCAGSMKRSPASGPSALVVASCPELSPLIDDSFGATTDKLASVGIQYRECREAALAP
jgi:hypothetical protein